MSSSIYKPSQAELESSYSPIVFPTQENENDLEDYIEILQGIVEQLSMPSLSDQILLTQMQEYCIVEEAIFKGTEAVVAQAKSQTAQQKIISLIERANGLLAEFQDSWDDKYWDKYETAKGGYKPPHSSQKTVKQVEKQIEELKDLALYLRRVDREQHFDMYDDNNKVLSMVDEEAKKYKESTLKENDKKTRRDCCNQCNII